jgi:monoamine oxidase
MTALPIIPLHSVTASSAPYVAVIGAGMTTAGDLAQAGVPFTIFEAQNRIGGRTYTEPKTFSVPYDHGSVWMHSVDKNPLPPLVKGTGYATTNEGESDTLMLQRWQGSK